MQRTLPSSKIRWDRKFRVLMVVGIAVVGWIGVHAATALLSAHAQAQSEINLVSRLAGSNHRLERRINQLQQRSTIIQAARGLGMVKAGERSYSVVGTR